MKTLMIAPATIALLTAMPAMAQNSENLSSEVTNSTAVLYQEGAETLDAMTIEELNALQLAKLQQSSIIASTDDENLVVYTAQTETAPAEEYMESSEYAEQQVEEAVEEADNATSYAETESYTGVGGPEYSSIEDAIKQDGELETIAAVAMNDDRFSTLVSLVKQAGLAETLMSDGEFTVFAPTNAAFDKLDPAVVEKLTNGENNDKLAKILKAHVVGSEYLASDIPMGETTLTTLGETDLVINHTQSGVTVDDASVIVTDVNASNGVIHAIDTVIIPEMGDDQ